MKFLEDFKWIKSGIYSIGSRFSVLIFGFGSFALLVRYLPKAQFGAWSLFVTITTIVEMSRNGLIQNALIKLLHSHDEKDSHKVITASWMINVFYSLVIYLILVAMSGLFSRSFHVPGLGPMFVYYGVTMALLIPLSQFNYLQQAKFSFSGIFWTAICRQGSFFLMVLAIFFLKIPMSLTSFVLLQSVSTLVGLVVAWFSARKLIASRFEWDWPIIARVFHFGKYVMGTNIFSLFFKSVDQFSIGWFLDANSVASYASAMRVSNLIEYPATSVAEVMYPHSTKRISEEGEHIVKGLYEKSVGLTLTITLPIVAATFLFADFIIWVIAGPEYAESAGILRITILFGLITPFNRQFGMAMDSSGRPHLNFLLLMFALVVNVISNYFFIQYLGVIGAAWGTLLSYVIISIIGHYVLARIFGVTFRGVVSSTVMYYQKAFDFVLRFLRTRKFS